MLRCYTIAFFILMYCCCAVNAQNNDACKGSEVKKAVKLLSKAESFKKAKKDYKIIREAYLDIFSEDSVFAEAYLSFGNAAYLQKDYRSAMFAYNHFIRLCDNAKGRYFYRRARAAYLAKEFKDAEKYYTAYLSQPDIDPELEIESDVNRYRSSCYANPVPFNPIPLKGVSTGDPEYLPAISADGELCYFTRRFNISSKNSLTPRSVEKFMVAHKTENGFSMGEVLPEPFNYKENNNEGGATISLDNEKIYFTVNDNGNFDIYTATQRNGIWSEILPVPGKLNDPKLWDSQPSVTSDGKTLYFASFRDSIYQTGDIYKSDLLQDGTWSEPQKLPGVINTVGTEKSPFIHSDNKTLYFSSDGHPGMGGFDIYMSRLGSDGEWSVPVGLGYPINTETDEIGFLVNTDGNKGYFASNKLNGAGGFDIYEFDLNPEVRPEKVLLITGSVRDENNNIPLNARIELKNVGTKEIVQLSYDTLTGRYASVLLFDSDYIMTVKKKGFGFVSSYLSKEDSLSAVRKIDLSLKEIRKGESFTLNNILYDFNSIEMNEVSKTVVTSFYEFLLENPELKIELQGHTDDVGNEIDNQILSEQRARGVFDFLLFLGTDPNRITYKGYGESMPINDNVTEEDRKLNRRTEFVIIEHSGTN